ncbi:MAG: hypothetical protein WBV96_09545, partial [Polyangia bacterium]
MPLLAPEGACTSTNVTAMGGGCGGNDGGGNVGGMGGGASSGAGGALLVIPDAGGDACIPTVAPAACNTPAGS